MLSRTQTRPKIIKTFTKYPFVVKINSKTLRVSNNLDRINEKIRNCGLIDFMVYPIHSYNYPTDCPNCMYEVRFPNETDKAIFICYIGG